MHHNFNSFSEFSDIFEPEEEEAPITERTFALAPVAHLIIVDKCEPLFYSADWAVIAMVGDVEIDRSNKSSFAHSDLFVKCWARRVIRHNKAKLRSMGVDVTASYVQWEGCIDDLDD